MQVKTYIDYVPAMSHNCNLTETLSVHLTNLTAKSTENKRFVNNL